MSIKAIKTTAEDLKEMTNLHVAGRAAELLKYFAEICIVKNIPVVTRPVGLACHIGVKRFLPHIHQ